jgi:hypothetical protein
MPRKLVDTVFAAKRLSEGARRQEVALELGVTVTSLSRALRRSGYQNPNKGLCSRCGKNPSDPLSTKGKWCLPCSTAYRREWYHANRDRVSKRSKDLRQQRVAANRAFVSEYLATHPCVDCGETDVDVLQFDHVRGDKELQISEAIFRWSLEAIKAEIAKCEVRCANDHMRVTKRRRLAQAA